jgi:hypothetical protein
MENYMFRAIAAITRFWKLSCYNLLTKLLTYSMVQSPSWEANWFAASQEIPRISRNPEVHYRTHKRPPPVFLVIKVIYNMHKPRGDVEI